MQFSSASLRSSHEYSDRFAMTILSSPFPDDNPSGFSPHFAANQEHPRFGHLVLLVFEAILQVVCVSAPGYIIARQGKFGAEAQKFLANLNLQIFLPCLIFTKIASQLTVGILLDLAIIPAIFAVQTLVSFLCALLISQLFGFSRRPKNFMTAMAVFGNSNSLPISLVLSLSKTISGLHWEKIPGDNDDEVAARGILYLMIFQQLGQVLRWSWGYHYLLAKPEEYNSRDQIERGENSNVEETRPLLESQPYSEDNTNCLASCETSCSALKKSKSCIAHNISQSDFESGSVTPITGQAFTSSCMPSPCSSSCSSYIDDIQNESFTLPKEAYRRAGTNETSQDESANQIVKVQQSTYLPLEPYSVPTRSETWLSKFKRAIAIFFFKARACVSGSYERAFGFMVLPLRITLSSVGSLLSKLWNGMNPPLWAMVAAMIVAYFPQIQYEFFSNGTLVNNSVTSAITQMGGVAVPLILVVLGANLSRNTLPTARRDDFQDPTEERKLVIASILARMLGPIILMTPLLALMAKYVNISILDDPIFIIVCFLLTGAPSALQLAQICQINNIYVGVMSRVLFQGYVVWILPSTLILIMLALEVLKWAAPPN